MPLQEQAGFGRICSERRGRGRGGRGGNQRHGASLHTAGADVQGHALLCRTAQGRLHLHLFCCLELQPSLYVPLTQN